MSEASPQEPTTANLASLFYSLVRTETAGADLSSHLAADTMRDVIANDFLLKATIWLLGYDASQPHAFNTQAPSRCIRPQDEGSHWATAWCVMDFLFARANLGTRHDDVITAINQRFVSPDATVNPALWLLDTARPVGDQRVAWYGKEYDNAVVTLALLQLKRQRNAPSAGLQWPADLLDRVDAALTGSLRWLWDRIHKSVESGTVDDEAIAVLEPLLVAVAEFEPFLVEKVWIGGSYPEKRAELFTAIESWISFLEARSPAPIGVEPRDPRDPRDPRNAPLPDNAELDLTADEAYALCRLVLVTRALPTGNLSAMEPLAIRAKKILLGYIEFLEMSLQRDLWGGNIPRILRLGTYVQAWDAVLKTPDAQCMAIVLKVLSMIKNDQFSNGSIFHSSLPTVHLTRSLIILWNWPSADLPLMTLFSKVLDSLTVRSSLERFQNLQLRKELVEAEHKSHGAAQHLARLERLIRAKDTQQRGIIARERRKRYVLLVILWAALTVCIIPIVDFVFRLSRPEVLQFAGVAASILGILLLVIEVIFLRGEIKGIGLDENS